MPDKRTELLGKLEGMGQSPVDQDNLSDLRKQQQLLTQEFIQAPTEQPQTSLANVLAQAIIPLLASGGDFESAATPLANLSASETKRVTQLDEVRRERERQSLGLLDDKIDSLEALQEKAKNREFQALQAELLSEDRKLGRESSEKLGYAKIASALDATSRQERRIRSTEGRAVLAEWRKTIPKDLEERASGVAQARALLDDVKSGNAVSEGTLKALLVKMVQGGRITDKDITLTVQDSLPSVADRFKNYLSGNPETTLTPEVLGGIEKMLNRISGEVGTEYQTAIGRVREYAPVIAPTLYESGELDTILGTFTNPLRGKPAVATGDDESYRKQLIEAIRKKRGG